MSGCSSSGAAGVGLPSSSTLTGARVVGGLGAPGPADLLLGAEHHLASTRLSGNPLIAGCPCVEVGPGLPELYPDPGAVGDLDEVAGHLDRSWYPNAGAWPRGAVLAGVEAAELGVDDVAA